LVVIELEDWPFGAARNCCASCMATAIGIGEIDLAG